MIANESFESGTRAAHERHTSGTRAAHDLYTSYASKILSRMFDQWAFQTWTRVFVGAAVFAAAFFGLMTVAGAVVEGNPAEFDRATRVISAAAFAGYVGTAWILRRAEHDEGGV